MAVGAGTHLNIILNAINATGPGLGAASRDVSRFSQHVVQQQRFVNSALRSGGSAWAGWGSLAVIAAGVAGDAMSDFQISNERLWADVETLVNTKLPQNLKKLRDHQYELAASYGVGIQETIESTYKTISAVYTDPVDQRRMFLAAENLSKAIRIPFQEATQLIIAGTRGTGRLSDSFMEVADAFTLAIRYGVTTGEEMAASLGKVVPYADRLNVSLKEVTASYAAITTAGVRGPEAATYLRQMLTQMADADQVINKLFRQHYGEGADQMLRDGAALLEVINKAVALAEKVNIPITTMFGRVQAGTAISVLAEEQNQRIYNLTMARASGAAEKEASKIRETTQYELSKMSAQFGLAANKIGGVFTDLIKVPAMSFFTEFADVLGLIDREASNNLQSLTLYREELSRLADAAEQGSYKSEMLMGSLDGLNEAVQLYRKGAVTDRTSPLEAAFYAAAKSQDGIDLYDMYGLKGRLSELGQKVLKDYLEDPSVVKKFLQPLPEGPRKEFREGILTGDFHQAIDASRVTGTEVSKLMVLLNDLSQAANDLNLNPYSVLQFLDTIKEAAKITVADLKQMKEDLEDAFTYAIPEASIHSSDLVEKMLKLQEQFEAGDTSILQITETMTGYVDELSELILSTDQATQEQKKQAQGNEALMETWRLARERMDEQNENLASGLLAYREGLIDSNTELTTQNELLYELERIDAATVIANLEHRVEMLSAAYGRNARETLQAEIQLQSFKKTASETAGVLFSMVDTLGLQLDQANQQQETFSSHSKLLYDAGYGTANETIQALSSTWAHYKNIYGEYSSEALSAKISLDSFRESLRSTSTSKIKDSFNFGKSFYDAQYQNKFGWADNIYNKSLETQQYLNRELEIESDWYDKILERIKDTEKHSHEHLSLIVEQNKSLDRQRKLEADIADSKYKQLESTYKINDEAFRHRENQYGNTIAGWENNYLKFGYGREEEHNILMARRAELEERFYKALELNALKASDVIAQEIRNLDRQIKEITEKVPPHMRTALTNEDRERWQVEDLKHQLGKLTDDEYLNTLEERKGFWGNVGYELGELQLEQMIQRLVESMQSEDEPKEDKFEAALDTIVASPIVEAIEKMEDTIRDEFGRVIEVDSSIDTTGRAIAGSTLEYAATQQVGKIPITARR